MGLQLLSFALSPDLGIRVITPLLIAAEAFPVPSIAVKACNRMGAVSLAHSWKNSMGRPSFPGALPLGRALIAVRISLNVSCLVKVSLISLETLIGTLVQQRCCASSVLGVFVSEEYSLV
jgi:hypothetical protein